MEQAEYEREAIDWSYIQFVDNQDVLDLIERKLGILDVLDEQCRFPRVSTFDFPLCLCPSLCAEMITAFSYTKLLLVGICILILFQNLTLKKRLLTESWFQNLTLKKRSLTESWV